VTTARLIALTLLLSLLAATLGVWGGARYVQARLQRPPAVHQILHQQLHLTAEQDRRIDGLERDYAAKRRALEAEMRAANTDLAQAYDAAHAWTPQAQAAIDRSHHAMEALQKETMLHVLAMRGVLTPDQTAQFDATVVKSLTRETP
jgi:Spy/CpxP family protein refolding chaperone